MTVDPDEYEQALREALAQGGADKTEEEIAAVIGRLDAIAYNHDPDAWCLDRDRRA